MSRVIIITKWLYDSSVCVCEQTCCFVLCPLHFSYFCVPSLFTTLPRPVSQLRRGRFFLCVCHTHTHNTQKKGSKMQPEPNAVWPIWNALVHIFRKKKTLWKFRTLTNTWAAFDPRPLCVIKKKLVLLQTMKQRALWNISSLHKLTKTEKKFEETEKWSTKEVFCWRNVWWTLCVDCISSWWASKVDQLAPR